MVVDVVLSKPQYEFITTKAKFPAMVAGLGSGKTEAAVQRLLSKKLTSPKTNVAYYLPTYDLINTIAIPRIEKILGTFGIQSKLNKNEKFIEIKGYGRIYLRTVDRPERIVGYEVAHSIVDELDTLPTDKAVEVWRKILARNREKTQESNTIGVATTPEGFKFVYDRWHRRGNEQYKIIKASTHSNAHNLPYDYIDNLMQEYPENLLKAYINGDFVNLNFSTVYSEYDRHKHNTYLSIQPSDTLHIGMDFNVGKMAAVVAVIRDGIPHIVDQHTDIMDTPAMIQRLKNAYQGHPIAIYPDASGKNRKSQNASNTDIQLLRNAGFIVYVNSANPLVRERVLAVNVKLKKNELYVNVDKCPAVVEALEQHAYDKNGEPDKTSRHDHINDALGYFVAYKYPVYGGHVRRLKLKGT